jgi:hypothetical protein
MESLQVSMVPYPTSAREAFLITIWAPWQYASDEHEASHVCIDRLANTPPSKMNQWFASDCGTLHARRRRILAALRHRSRWIGRAFGPRYPWIQGAPWRSSLRMEYVMGSSSGRRLKESMRGPERWRANFPLQGWVGEARLLGGFHSVMYAAWP